MNTHAIAYVKALARNAKASIVCNSAHNYYDIHDDVTGVMRDLRSDLIAWGLPAELFHTDWRTTFPDVGPSPSRKVHPRQRAIDDWLSRNGDHNWVAFDDEEFDVSGRQILIDFETGIDQAAFRKALSVWNLELPAELD